VLVDEIFDHENYCATDCKAEKRADDSNDNVLLYSRLKNVNYFFFAGINLDFCFNIFVHKIVLDQRVTASFHSRASELRIFESQARPKLILRLGKMITNVAESIIAELAADCGKYYN